MEEKNRQKSPSDVNDGGVASKEVEGEGRVLVGNTLPTVLIRRKVAIKPVNGYDFKGAIEGKEIFSFWGHSNTLEAVKELLGVDLTPKEERPALALDQNKLPTLYGETFREIWLINPNYRGSYRPKIGEEVDTNKIEGWQILKATFEGA